MTARVRAMPKPGDAFGEWVIVADAEPSPSGERRFMCRCSCGVERPVQWSNMRKGISRSCGHDRSARSANGKLRLVDRTGQVSDSGALRVIARAGSKHGNATWVYECLPCGRRSSTTWANIKRALSCGCLTSEIAALDAQATVECRRGHDLDGLRLRGDGSGRYQRFCSTCDPGRPVAPGVPR